MRRPIRSTMLSTTLLAASLTIHAPFAHGQTPETMTITPDVFHEAVLAQCAEDVAKANQFERCRANLSEVRQYRDELQGQLDVFEGIDEKRLELVRREALLQAELDRRWEWSTWALLVGASALVGFGAGFAVGL